MYLKRRAHIIAWAETSGPLVVPGASDLDREQRDFMNSVLHSMYVAARDRGVTIFDDAAATQGLARFSVDLHDEGRPLSTVLTVPGMSDAEMTSWLEDHATVMGKGRYFVFYETL